MCTHIFRYGSYYYIQFLQYMCLNKIHVKCARRETLGLATHVHVLCLGFSGQDTCIINSTPHYTIICTLLLCFYYLHIPCQQRHRASCVKDVQQDVTEAIGNALRSLRLRQIMAKLLFLLNVLCYLNN